MNFIDFGRAHGISIDPSKLHPSDRIKRCGTVAKPNSTNGAYYWDGQRGWVFDWSSEAKVQWFNDPSAAPWTAEEQRAWKEKRKADLAAKRKEWERAAQRASALIRTAKSGRHNYLHLKGFPDQFALVAQDGAMVVPMRNVTTDELQGAQVIKWVPEETTYTKKMLPGMRAKEATFRIGSKRATETFLCEGYATGLSIAAALRSVALTASVLVCFSAGNLQTVAPKVPGRTMVFADNDASGTGQEAAIATGLPYVTSPVVGEDANDLHRRAGLMAVVAKIMEARAM